MLDQNQRIFAEIFRTSIPWRLETFTQNFWSSGFFGSWFFRIDVLSCRLLSCHVLSCRNLQNFKPLETGDVHSELLVFSLLWCLVLQNLQVLNAGDVQQNFWSSGFFKHLIRSTIFKGWDCSLELPVSASSEASWQIFRTC